MSLISELDFKFDIIGVSETKIIQTRDPISNFSVPSYSFLSHSTQSNAEGAGSLVSKNIKYHIRDEFNISTKDFECLAVETQCNNERNTDRHPLSSLENFLSCLTPVIEKSQL